MTMEVVLGLSALFSLSLTLERKGQRERRTGTDVSFHLFVHSLVDSRTCPELVALVYGDNAITN